MHIYIDIVYMWLHENPFLAVWKWGILIWFCYRPGLWDR